MLNYIVRFLFILFCFLTINTAQATSSHASAIKKVLLVVAMESEAKPLISRFQLHKVNHSFSNLPMQGYVGKYHNLNIMLIMNGTDPLNKVQNIGTQPATLSTYLGIEYFHPDLIISIGTAGGVEKNDAKLKDIYVSQKINFYSRRLSSDGYHEYGIGAYPSADFSLIYQQIGLKPGIVCSGDSFDENTTDYNLFIKQHCSAIDMEAAGVAWVSMLTHTPMIAIKGITNFVKGDDIHKQYEENIQSVSAELSKKLKMLLNALASSQ